MKNPFLTSVLSAGLIVLVGCETMYNMMDALNEAHTYNSSAIAGGGAVAGKDYITGLAPCEESRAYFAKSSSSQTEKVTVTPGNDKGTGVEWTDDGGIVIPPGVTIEFVNNGYCMDPHLPAPKSGEEIQLVKTASLLPNKMRGTYKNLMQRAAAGDEEIEDNMQRLVWALRTAGSDDAMATYLTDRQMEILEENSSSEYDGIDSFDGLFDRLVDDAKKQLAQTIADVTSVRIGDVTYNAFDLMDPDKGMEKVAAHMDALAAMSKNLPVAKTGFNYGQIENGIYTDIKGNGVLSFNAKIANATSQSYTFYPYDYVGQVGSGDNSSAGTFYATSSTSMRQRITINKPNSVSAVQSSRQEVISNVSVDPKRDISGEGAFRYVAEQFGFVYLDTENARRKAADDVIESYSTEVGESIAGVVIANGGKGLSILDTVDGGLNVGYSEGKFLGDFVTSICLGNWDGAAKATEGYVVDRVFGTARAFWNGTMWLFSHALGE